MAPTTTTGVAPFGPYQTWYRITGSLHNPRGNKSVKRPLVVLHGGPAASHIQYTIMDDIAHKFDIPIVMYDQVGCGQSTLLPDKGGEFWTVGLFLAELDNLLGYLGISEYDLLGHSWGTMLAAEHAVLQPSGLRHLVLVSGPADMAFASTEMMRLVNELPGDLPEIIKRHEVYGAPSSKEYEEAVEVYQRMHVLRIRPIPWQCKEAVKSIERSKHIHEAMVGHYSSGVVGNLKNWTIADRLHLIDAKTLVINGKHDTITEAAVWPFLEMVRDARWVRMEESSHRSLYEERGRFMQVVGEFVTA